MLLFEKFIKHYINQQKKKDLGRYWKHKAFFSHLFYDLYERIKKLPKTRVPSYSSRIELVAFNT